jgi:hypothetical protein
MKSIHYRARLLVAQSHGECTLSEAYSALAKRRRRAQSNGVLHVTAADRKAFENVEQPQRRYWWQDL